MPRLGLKSYYQQKLEELDVILREKEQNVRRLEAQRNDWNEKGAFELIWNMEGRRSAKDFAVDGLALMFSCVRPSVSPHALSRLFVSQLY